MHDGGLVLRIGDAVHQQLEMRGVLLVQRAVRTQVAEGAVGQLQVQRAQAQLPEQPEDGPRRRRGNRPPRPATEPAPAAGELCRRHLAAQVGGVGQVDVFFIF